VLSVLSEDVESELSVASGISEALVSCRRDPGRFIRDVLGVPEGYLWDKPRAIAQSVADHQLTAVPAGHSVSKTWLGGRIVPWFKCCFRPSTVITTAPSDNQVRNQLWREIAGAYQGSVIPLGGKLTGLQWDMRLSEEELSKLPREDRENFAKDFALGFSTSPDSASDHATKMAGWHNYWLLVILDEACGILPQIWRTVMEALIINRRCKVLAIGNPTDPESDFAHACRKDGELGHLEVSSDSYVSDEGWHVIPVSVLDTPNYQLGREVVPGVAGREFERQILRKHKRGSNGWLIRVRGAFPKYKHGSYYADLVNQLRSGGRIGSVPHHPGYKVHTVWDIGYTTAVWFWQQRGPSPHVVRYHEAQGLGMDGWGRLLEEFSDEFGYHYGRHFAPFDTTTQNGVKIITGQSIIDAASASGVKFEVLPLERSVVTEGIPRTREVLPLCYFDKVACERGLWCLRTYHEAQNRSMSTDDVPVFTGRPEHGPESHGADAFRYLSLALPRLASRQESASSRESARQLRAKYGRPG